LSNPFAFHNGSDTKLNGISFSEIRWTPPNRHGLLWIGIVAGCSAFDRDPARKARRVTTSAASPLVSSVTFVAGIVATDRKFPMCRALSHAPVGRSGWARRDARFCVPRTPKQGEPKWNFRNGLSME
jgi:hypothetical protein